MKFAIIAATTLGVIAAPVMAQHVERRVETRTTVVRHDEHVRGPVIVRKAHRRQVCTVRWVHHKKVRRCTWR